MASLLHLLHHLRSLAAPGEPASDADLLARFSRGQDESAFTQLVARHGPLVLNVCRRVLGEVHAAEDAFQATFLILARKAGALRKPAALAGWLYGVAYRVARKARRGPHLATLPVEFPDNRPDILAETSARDLLALVEEEIQRLPRSSRLAVEMCCLEGLSQEEAAVRLGWTPGSVKGRLERGRQRLRERLARRGIALTSTLGLMLATRATASASLVATTVRASVVFATNAQAGGVISEQVIALAQRGMRDMFVTKVKTALLALTVLAAVGVGAGWVASGPGKGVPRAMASEPAAKVAQAPAAPDQKAAVANAKKELDLLAQEAEAAEARASKSLIAEREQLVELESRLFDAEARVKEARLPTTVETTLARKLAKLEADLLDLKDRAGKAQSIEAIKAQAKQITEVQSKIDFAKAEKKVLVKQLNEEVIDLRKQMVRVEEAIRGLERQRTLQREDAARTKENALQKVRQLEGLATTPAAEPGQKALERKLDAVLTQLAEIRRELDRTRPVPPKK